MDSRILVAVLVLRATLLLIVATSLFHAAGTQELLATAKILRTQAENSANHSRGATSDLTVFKHQLRDFVEERLVRLSTAGETTDSVAKSIMDELTAAGLTPISGAEAPPF